MIKLKIELIVVAMAIRSLRKLLHDLANLKIRNNRRDLKAAIALNDLFDPL
jgi:hypothetical protein